MTEAKWPRQVYACMAPGCSYLAPVTSTSFGAMEVCPAHGTILVLLLVQPVAPG